VNEVVLEETERARPGRRRLWWWARAPLVVAAARLRSHPARVLLVVIGVAASIAMLVAVNGGSLTARDRAVQRAFAGLPESERSFRVDAFGLAPGQGYRTADATIRGALASLTPRAPLRGTFFRELRVGGELVQLASLDGLGRLVRLRSGRLPRVCRPARCEVLGLRTGGQGSLSQTGIHLVRVGLADVPARALFGDSLQAVHENNGERPVLLLAAGAAAFDRLPAFAGIYRSYSWIVPIDPKRLHVWQIGALLARESRAQAELARQTDAYELSGPDTALVGARSKGRIAAQRMMLVGGEVSTLLLGFALVVAVGLRRGLGNERRRLLQRGARRPHLWLAFGAEVSAMTVAGAALGIVGGVVAVALISRSAGVPAGAILRHSLGSPLGAALVAAAWLGATTAILVVGHSRERELRGPRLRLLDVAALGAAVAVALGLARGGLSADALASGGNSTLLLLLPGLTCFVAAVLAGRLLGPLMRLAERAARQAPIALRLALLALARAPSRTVATAAFLLVSLGLALFAAGYRSTLERGARDEAAFSVPLDFSLTEGSRLVLPFDAASTARYEALAPGVRAVPIVRQPATVAGLGTSVLSPTVLGVPTGALPELHWRSDFSDLSRAELARRLGADGPAALRGVPIPRGATTLSLGVRIDGVAVRLDLAAEDGRGRIVLVPLGERGPGASQLTARLPGGLRQVVGVELSLATAEQLGFSHREAEAGEASVPAGRMTLGPLRAGDRVLTTWRGWVARGGAQLTPGGGVAYAFTAGQTMLLREPQATDGRPLGVVVSPEIARAAGPDGSITVDFGDVRVPARIVGVAGRFPDSEQQGEGFVIADESRLATVLDSRLPGRGTPQELWLAVPKSAVGAVARELRRPPFSALDLASRRDIEQTLAGDPLARGLTLTLGAAAVIALALAAVGFWLALVSDLRDERGELFDLEAQGVSPSTLRRQFRLRAALLLALGGVGGVALGLFLSRLVVALVRVSAVTESPQPPLRLEPAWVPAGAGLAALLVAVAVVVELTTRRAFRGDTPARGSWSLE
jgi:hypothetical protein